MEATAIINFFAKHPAILAITLIAVGIVSTFFGGKVFHVVFALVSGVVTFVIAILLCSVFGGLKALDSNVVTAGSVFSAVICFLFSIGLAVLIGFLTTKVKSFGPSLLGFIGGAIFGVWVNFLTIGQFYQSTFISVTLALAFGIATAIYTFRYTKTLAVPMTSIVGSYLIVYGAGMIFGGFPSQVHEIEHHEDLMKYETYHWYYLGAYLLLVVGGVTFQRHQKYHLNFSDGYDLDADEIEQIVDDYYKKQPNAIN